MKIIVLIFSIISMVQAFALGDTSFSPADTEAMGSSAATLNQVTKDPEEEEIQEEELFEDLDQPNEEEQREEEIGQRRFDVVPSEQ